MLVLYYIITMILTNKLVVPEQQCEEYHFKTPFYPGKSCEKIYTNNPESHNMPGYYWITDGPTKVYCGMNYTGSSCLNIYNGNPETANKPGYYRINNNQWTYCNMTAISINTAGDLISTCAGVGGGWRKIVNINISAGDNCPNGWRKDTYSGVSFCRVVSDDRHTCSSANFSTDGISYQRVCGRARGYQKGYSVGFYSYHYHGQSIDGYYADGLLITYDRFRQHIWTYTLGRLDNRIDTCCNCPCAVGGGSAPPPFVGTNYYCESGAANIYNTTTYYFNDPLWDRSGCITSNCCATPTQPWFYRELSGATTSDLQARICSYYRFDAGSPLIKQFELYIQ